MSNHRHHRITGNSMDRLGLEDGMLVRVRLADTAHSGQVVAVLEEDGGIIVKRLWWDGHGAWLVPESFDDRHEARRAREGERILGVIDELPAKPWRHLIEPPFVIRGADALRMLEAYVPAPPPPRPQEDNPYQAWRKNPLLPITPAPYQPKGYVGPWMEPELMPDDERTPPLARLLDDLLDTVPDFPPPDLERTLGFKRGDFERFKQGYVPPWEELQRFGRRIEHGFGLSILGGLDTLHSIATGRHK